MTATRGTRAALFTALALSSAACMGAAPERDSSASLVQQLTSASEAQAQTPAAHAAPAHPRDPAPAVIRGIYVNAYAAGNPVTRARLVALTDSTEINTWVVDVKDEDGVRYTSALPLAVEATHVRSIPVRDLRALA
ncbi:MAG TPA: putative glycoside hydrolase, partial [Longimicrobium sp.]|nr:putative glycoside hydrolase [Longimicrobium sp.]